MRFSNTHLGWQVRVGGATGIGRTGEPSRRRIRTRDVTDTALTAESPSHAGSVQGFFRLGAVCAVLVALLSVIYAVAYLVVAPSAQRGSDVGALMRSYHAHPAGMRLASLCLAASGITSGLAVAALCGWLSRGRARPALAWAQAAGVAGGLLTAAHGLGDLVSLNAQSARYVHGAAAVRSAVEAQHALPSAVDPRGLVTFGLTGLVVGALALSVRGRRPRLGALGLILGADLLVLFAATAFGVHGLVLASGGLASLVLGPAWWVGVAGLLRASP